MRAFPALGFDPCPGEPATVREIAATLRRSGDAMTRAADILRGQEDVWRGQAALAFHDWVGVEAPEQLVKAQQSFVHAGTALEGWADVLDAGQRRADALEAEAVEASRRTAVLQERERVLQHQSYEANPLVAMAGPWPRPTAPPYPGPYEELERQAGVVRAQLAHAVVQEREIAASAARLRDEVTDQAATTARQLVAAQEMAPLAPGFWRRAAGLVVDVAGGFWQWETDPMGFLKDHQEALKLISDVTGFLSSVLGVLAFVAFLQPLAMPAVILGGVSTLSAYGAAVGETGSWREGFTDEVKLGIVTTAMGFGAVKLGQAVTKAAKGGNYTRTGGTMLGKTYGKRETAVGVFTVAKRGALPMEPAEGSLRFVHVKVEMLSAIPDVATVVTSAPAWNDRARAFASGSLGMAPR